MNNLLTSDLLYFVLIKDLQARLIILCCRSSVLQRLSDQPGRRLLRHLIPCSHAMRLVNVSFVFLEKRSTDQSGAESGAAVKHRSPCPCCSVKIFFLFTFFIFFRFHLDFITLNTCAYVCFNRAESGFEKMFAESDQKKYTSALLQAFRDRHVS